MRLLTVSACWLFSKRKSHPMLPRVVAVATPSGGLLDRRLLDSDLRPAFIKEGAMFYNSDQTANSTVPKHESDCPGPGIRCLIALLLLAVPCLGLATPFPQSPISTEAVQGEQS